MINLKTQLRNYSPIPNMTRFLVCMLDNTVMLFFSDSLCLFACEEADNCLFAC